MKRVLIALAVLILLALLAVVVWLYARTSPDAGTLGGLLSVEQFVENKGLASVSTAASCSAPDSIFADADIQSGLRTVRTLSREEPVCIAAKGSWAIAAPLHGGWFSGGAEHQFCIDSTGARYEIVGPLASSSCPERYAASTLRIFVQDSSCLPQATYTLDVANGMDPRSVNVCPN